MISGDLPEEEREEQRPDVRPVDVGVGHQDDAVITKLANVEHRLSPRRDADGGDHRVAVRAILDFRRWPRQALCCSIDSPSGSANSHPSAVISVPTARPSRACDRARARSTLRILPLSGKIAWKSPVASLLGAAAGALALDDVDLALRRILRLGNRRACPRAR